MNHHVITDLQYQEYVRLRALFEHRALDYLVTAMQGPVGTDGMPEQIAVCSASTGTVENSTLYTKVNTSRVEQS